MSSITTSTATRTAPGARVPRGATPRGVLEAVDRAPWLPDDPRERVHGWGVLGQPFETGHVLGLRRWSASAVGPAYTTVWHRSPAGRWSFWSTQPPEVSCNRFAGERVDATAVTPIAVAWTGPAGVSVTVPEVGLVWTMQLAATPRTRLLSAVASRMPDRVRSHQGVLRALGPLAGRLLGTGSLGVTGGMPNGQQFAMTPYRIWSVAHAQAELAGTDLGRPAPLARPERIGDFRIPQRGLVAVGSLLVERLDPARHSTRLVRTAPAVRR